jgi:hypothetical protein
MPAAIACLSESGIASIPLAQPDQREDQEENTGDAVGAERHLPRAAEAAGDRPGHHQREVEVVAHRRRDRDRIVGPQAHECGRERRGDTGRGEDGPRLHAGRRQHGRLTNTM